MLKEFVIVLFFTLISSFNCLTAYNAEAQEKLPYGIIAANNSFAFKLLGELTNTKDNVVFSPYSISSALSMLAAGAKDQTQIQILKTLSLTNFNSQSLSEIEELQHMIARKSEIEGARLDIANSLWMQSDYPLLDTYREIVSKNFSALINRVDFRTKTEETRLEINKWVADKTQNKITDLIGLGALGSSSRMVLVNAIYFLAAWESPFSELSTYEGNFKTFDTENSLARFMSQKKYFKYAENSELQVIELPYIGNTAAIDILLPKSKDAAAINNIKTFDSIEALLNSMKSTEVQLHIPKFKVESTYSLLRVLQKLGINDAFLQGKADFSAISGNQELFANEVIHKAVIELDEKGTEAAAATAIAMRGGSAMQPVNPVLFKADHPFIFMLKDLKTSTILFIGLVKNPHN